MLPMIAIFVINSTAMTSNIAASIPLTVLASRWFSKQIIHLDYLNTFKTLSHLLTQRLV